MLNDKFLDEEFIIDEIFKQILNESPKYDPEFNGVKQYITKIKADLHEFDFSFHINFLTHATWLIN